MNTNKTIFILCCIGIMSIAFISCQHSNQDVSYRRPHCSYKDEIISINNKYSTLVPHYDNSTKYRKLRSDVDGWSIAAADATGAMTTAWETYKSTKNPGLSIGVGIIGGTTASLAAYFTQQEDSTQGCMAKLHNDVYAIDLRYPINASSITRDELWFSDFFFGQAGVYHNYLVKSVLLDSRYVDLKEKPIDNVFGDFIEILSSEGTFDSYELWEGYKFYEETMHDDYGKNFLSLMPEECTQYFSEYLSIAENIPADKCYDYTQEYLLALNQAYETESDIENILALGVGIEVWYYSNSLWNYYIPRPNQVSTFILQLSDDKWFITPFKDRIYTLLASGEVKTIGVPKFGNKCLTEIFFFDNIEEYLALEDSYEKYVFRSDLMFIKEISTDIEMDMNYLDSILGIYSVKELEEDSSIRYVSFENGKFSEIEQ